MVFWPFVALRTALCTFGTPGRTYPGQVRQGENVVGYLVVCFLVCGNGGGDGDACGVCCRWWLWYVVVVVVVMFLLGRCWCRRYCYHRYTCNLVIVALCRCVRRCQCCCSCSRLLGPCRRSRRRCCRLSDAAVECASERRFP